MSLCCTTTTDVVAATIQFYTRIKRKKEKTYFYTSLNYSLFKLRVFMVVEGCLPKHNPSR